ncbi:TVP38/TMEM64 family protein [Salipaludibacillus daqingensis]|uniref:TVP38/TMEM64 family protein n=1 Tax=Salipaludibacillus daqingensis TaxID=3041001 RepID=UPI002474F7D8|nr:TVP38/TMEM64 family protein [Salipaludibacillus daqingensis]
MVSKKNVLFIIFALVLFVIIYLSFPSVRLFIDESVMRLASGDISEVRDYLMTFGMWAPIISTFMMILSVLIAPIPAFLPTFANGLLFGTFFGFILSWTSALIGATIAFYIAKNLGRPFVEKFVSVRALNWTDRFISRFGLQSIITARIVPVVSYGIVSYTAGLTSLRFRTYIIGSAIGQTPATILYSYLGENASESIWMLYLAFAIIFFMSFATPYFKSMFEKKEVTRVRK